MKNIFTTCIVAFILAGCANEISINEPVMPDEVSFADHPQNGRYITELKEYQRRTHAPGAVLAITKKDERPWIGASGFSNLEHRSPMSTNTQFRTGSITKMFTATVILRMAEQGKLRLDDPLSVLLPECKGKIQQTDKITVRHLLAHLSGIVDPPNENMQYQADIINDPKRMQNMSVDDKLAKYVYGEKLKFSPGSNYSYSNTNYWLLGKIAEKLAGKNIQTLMKEYIFEPLNMQDSYLDIRDDRNVARGYAELYSDGKLFDVTTWDRAEGDGEADGGLISTAKDLQLFITGLFSNRLVSAATLQEMKRIQLKGCDSPGCEYGLGLEIWRTAVGRAYGHNGGLAGIEANVLYYEDTGDTSVLYKNNGNGSDKSFLEKLIDD